VESSVVPPSRNPAPTPPDVVSVVLHDVDLDDQTFRVREGRSEKRYPSSQDLVPPPQLPILWRHAPPFVAVRGHDYLDAVASEQGRSARVEAVFLEPPDGSRSASLVDAMVLACKGDGGRYRLTTRECSRAIRHLQDAGCGAVGVRDFVVRLGVPTRTAVRARALARVQPEIWHYLELRVITLAHAEILQKYADALSQSPPSVPDSARARHVRSKVHELVELVRSGGLSSQALKDTIWPPRARRNPAERNVWQRLSADRCRTTQCTFSRRSNPELLRRFAEQYRGLARLLCEWTEEHRSPDAGRSGPRGP